ncbi:MAG: hypothetical protein DYG92_02640 [Leptolyngbya sp. PLA1]|nr:hypothetical protein [Leptolyngbya sp. PLA1]
MESVIASGVLALLVVAGLNATGALGAARRDLGDRALAAGLAAALLSEITSKPYEDPTNAEGKLGQESDETLARDAFDDVDDYAGLMESPPLDASGIALTTEAGWEQSVDVRFATFDGGAITEISDDLGLKQITVTVKLRGKVMASFSAIRARGWDDAKP